LLREPSVLEPPEPEQQAKNLHSQQAVARPRIESKKIEQA
jgi:hypothetical protein